LRHSCPNTPVVLVGTKLDKREDPEVLQTLAQHGQQPVTMVNGKALKDKIGAYAYVECSAKTQKGLREVFEQVIRAHICPNTSASGATPKKQCLLL